MTPACEACYVELANCENGPCQSACEGQPFHDAGNIPDSGDVSDASDAHVADSGSDP
jgi:hypothetical protein